MAITILIADDNASLRKELRRILDADSELRVVGEASSGKEAVEQALLLAPDVVLMDIEMERVDAGIVAAREIHESNPNTRIIVLTIHNDEYTVLAAFQSGIVDFLTKEQASSDLVEAVRLAIKDKSPMRPLVAHYLRNELSAFQQREEKLMYTIRIVSTLTASELAILRDIVAGKSRKQIARERFVELVTIKKHVNGIHKKFGTRDTRGIVRKIKELGIFEVLDSIFETRGLQS